jgi:hypothetical protein
VLYWAAVVLQGHPSAATDRVAAMSHICKLEAERVRTAQRSLTGRALRAARTQHALASICPDLPETVYPLLIELGTFGTGGRSADVASE